jgi:hypothetical protein
VNVSRLRSPRRDWALVGAAGPGMNLLILSGEGLDVYRRLEQFGLLIILALLFLVPQAQILLSVVIFGLVELLSTPFGVWADVEPLLRGLLFR